MLQYFWLLIKIVCLQLLTQQTNALIPTVCTGNATNSGVCCPRSHMTGMVCGGPRRGFCGRIKLPAEHIPEVFMYDDRTEWPKRFFKKLCRCKGNFYGINCDDCYFGWKGRHCNIRDIRVRQNALKLSKYQRNILRYVIDKSLYTPSDYSVYIDKNNALQDPIVKPIKWQPATVQFVMAFLHRFGSRATLFEDYLDCQNFGFLNYNHDGVIFAPWHRYYLLFWERELSKIAYKEFGIKDFAIAYWEWTGKKKCDICTNDFVGAVGEEDKYGVRIHQGSPFYNWTEFCVEPSDALENPCYGCYTTGVFGKLTRAWNNHEFPTKKDVEFALSIRTFYKKSKSPEKQCNTFEEALEGSCGAPGTDDVFFFTHNKVHTMIDGSMCCVGTAANDPIFIFHHTQADRMFEAWYQRYNPSVKEYPTKGVRPGHARDAYMIGFIPIATNAEMFTDSRRLGYFYDTLEFGKDYSKEEKDDSKKEKDDEALDKDLTKMIDNTDLTDDIL